MKNLRILRGAQVDQMTGLTRANRYSKHDPKSPYFDPTFPRPISLGMRAVGYIESEVIAWIEKRIALSRNPDSPLPPKLKPGTKKIQS